MNKKYTYVWVSLVILVFGIIFIPKIVDRINGGTIVQNDRMNVEKGGSKDGSVEEGDAEKGSPGEGNREEEVNEDNRSKALAYVTFDGEKRKVPEFELIDQDSTVVSEEDYKGKVFVVEFFFTSCPSICPIMTKNLVALQEEFSGHPDFGIASFSITPDFDTPSVLKEYAVENGIENPDWHLMTGDRDEIYALANQGFNIFAAENPDAPGGFEHSGLFALVDREGYLRSRTDSYGNPIVYYRGMITEEKGENAQGEHEQISILRQDIRKLLEE